MSTHSSRTSVIVAAASIVLATACAGATVVAPTPSVAVATSAPTPTPTVAPTPSPSPRRFKVGETANYASGLKVTLERWDTPATCRLPPRGDAAPPSPGTRYVLISVRITNGSSASVSATTDRWRINDSNGVRHAEQVGVCEVGSNFLGGTLLAGETFGGVMVFSGIPAADNRLTVVADLPGFAPAMWELY